MYRKAINVLRKFLYQVGSIYKKTLYFSKDFKKFSNIKFHENPSSGSRVAPCGPGA